MSLTITLASDFIERMANPAYGIRTNEEYALRLAKLAMTDTFRSTITQEVGHLDDPQTLSAHGWLWLLRWARAERVRFNQKLLLLLAESWSTVTMLIATIEASDEELELDSESVNQLNSKTDFYLVRSLIDSCTRDRTQEGSDSPDEFTLEPEVDRAERLLVALMQIGTPSALSNARNLLRRRWRGSEALGKFFNSLCEQVDLETKDEWLRHLRSNAE